jgi:cold shock CspA family protein
MRVVMYSASKLYGFVGGEAGQVFFHLESFHPGNPPPICGEEVMVEFIPKEVGAERAPRASKVERISTPEYLHGVVDSFNEQRGWGFIQSDGGESFYLHRSEVLDGRLPLAGRRVSFYRGFRENRPRACYVRVET